MEKKPELAKEEIIIEEEENLSFKLPDKIEKINEMVSIINEYK
jgi:hypothetical protein